MEQVLASSYANLYTAEEDKKATVFGYWVNDPERYGVAEVTRRQLPLCGEAG